MRTAAILTAFVIVFSASDFHAVGEDLQLTAGMERIQRELADSAISLLERYGTTFYALGMYLTADGELRKVVPHQSVPLVPALIADSLRSAVRRIDRSTVSVVGIAVDMPDKQMVQIELEDANLRCRQVKRRYRFEQQGTVAFLSPQISECQPSLLSETGELDRK